MASFGDPNSYGQYFRECEQRDIENGASRDEARHTREMYEANGEEWEGQYSGKPGY